MKLFDYQEKVLNSDAQTLICNWERGSGATYTLANLILQNKPEFVVYVGDIGVIRDKIKEVIKILGIKNDIKHLGMNREGVEVDFYCSRPIKILSLKTAKSFPQNRYIDYDYILFDGMLPFNTGLKTKQVISMVTINNSDKVLQQLYGKYVQIQEEIHNIKENSDIKELISQGLRLTMNSSKSNWDIDRLINYSCYIDAIKTILKYIDALGRVIKRDEECKVLDEVNIFVDNEVDKLYKALANETISYYGLIEVVNYMSKIKMMIKR